MNPRIRPAQVKPHSIHHAPCAVRQHCTAAAIVPHNLHALHITCLQHDLHQDIEHFYVGMQNTTVCASAVCTQNAVGLCAASDTVHTAASTPYASVTPYVTAKVAVHPLAVCVPGPCL